MNAKRKSTKKCSPEVTDRITIRRVRSSDVFELVYPRSVVQRTDDMKEVRKMLAAGEIDVAEDELRWLVGGCEALLEGHRMLGDIALGERQWDLARVHFGYAYQLGLDAAKRAKPRGTLPHGRPANRDLHASGRGLAEALCQLGQLDLAKQVVKQLLAWDPSDPLEVKGLVENL
ncbi:MAG: tetratricopeptide repeat protein [Pirellulales bacterium]|nr:tetratricopeptide repeat protein [Pirellulales bacterium]